jgi:hypothetical protein
MKPPRNAYPIAKTVATWPRGSSTEPAVQTAPLEECTSLILKP